MLGALAYVRRLPQIGVSVAAPRRGAMRCMMVRPFVTRLQGGVAGECNEKVVIVVLWIIAWVSYS